MELNSISLANLYHVTAQAPTYSLTPQERAEQSRLIQAVKTVNQSGVFGNSEELVFTLDQPTGRPVIQLIDRETKKVVQQIPPEYLLRLAEDPARIVG
jgi:flagellar protein FlaG